MFVESNVKWRNEIIKSKVCINIKQSEFVDVGKNV